MGVPRPRARARARTSDRRTEDAERHDGTEGRGRGRSGARGAPGALRGGDMSKSVAKALRGAIGREKNRGISTFLFAHPGRIRAFATDLDNPRRRGPLHGRRPRRSPRSRDAPTGGRTRPRTPRRALCTRTSTFNRTSRVQNAPLESIMHISTITGPTRSSPPRTASAHTIPRRPPFQVAGSRRPLVRPRPRGPPASAARRAGPMVWKGRVGWRSHAQR